MASPQDADSYDKLQDSVLSRVLLIKLDPAAGNSNADYLQDVAEVCPLAYGSSENIVQDTPSDRIGLISKNCPNVFLSTLSCNCEDSQCIASGAVRQPQLPFTHKKPGPALASTPCAGFGRKCSRNSV